MLRMLKKISYILAILALGTIGGMIWQATLLPYLAQHPWFENLWFIKEFQERKTIIFPTEEIYIQENVALTGVVEKVEKMAVGVRAETKKGNIIEGSGLVLTSDGLVITLAELVPEGANLSFFLNGEKVAFEIKKSDAQKNLALIRIEKEGLATSSFADLSEIKRGQRVFLIGVLFFDGKPQRMVNEGIIKYFDNNFIRTNIFEKDILNGSPLFDIEGNALGINTIDLEGKVTTIPISEIQAFAGF